MALLNMIHEFFVLIEPWIAVCVFATQIFILVLIKKKDLESAGLWQDVKNNVLKGIHKYSENFKNNADKKENVETVKKLVEVANKEKEPPKKEESNNE